MSALQRDIALGHGCAARRKAAGRSSPTPAAWARAWTCRRSTRCCSASPKESVIDIVQAVGRALRRHGDTDTATVIVPALVPDDGEDGEPDGGRYEHVLHVIRAMCAHDDDLADALRRRPRPRAADPDGPASGLPSRIAVSPRPASSRPPWTRCVSTCWTRTTSSWWDGYGHARAYHQEHGNLDVPHAYVTAGGYPLGTWLTAQRAERNSGDPGRRAHPAAGRARHDLGPARRRLDERIPRAARVPGRRTGTSRSPWTTSPPTASGSPSGRAPSETPTAPGRCTARAGAAGGDRVHPPARTKARWTRRYEQLAAAVTRLGGPGKPARRLARGDLAGRPELAHHRGKLADDKIALLEKPGSSSAAQTRGIPPTATSRHSRTSTATCASPTATRAPAGSTSATGRPTSASGARPSLPYWCETG